MTGRASDEDISAIEAKAQYYLDKKTDGLFDEVIEELKPLLPRLSRKSEIRKILSAAYLERGDANYVCGNKDRAIADWEESLRIDRENWKAMDNLSYFYSSHSGKSI